MSLLREQGVVLRTYRLGEADRIIVLLTHEHGKVRAVAKGVRRTASRFGGRLEPLSHVSLILWQGRGDLDVINQAEVIDNFRGVRQDLDRVTKGLSLLEVADQLAQERHADPRLYVMLVARPAGAGRARRQPHPPGAGLLLKVAGARGGRSGAGGVRLVRGARRGDRAGGLRLAGGRGAVPAMPPGPTLEP